jgi:nicotinamide riboside kinase
VESLARNPRNDAESMIRVVCTGSESTGKSSLAAALAVHYGVDAVPEFVRAFAAGKGAPIEFTDHGAIARGQIALEDEYLARLQSHTHPALLLQDTDLLSTVVYCRHYFGRCPEWIEQAARQRTPALYLLCHPDIPWVADGIRDRGHVREEMHALFEQAVAQTGAPRIDLLGDYGERERRARRAIDALLHSTTSAAADQR